MKSIGKIEVTRTINNHVERSERFYITTLTCDEMDKYMSAVRRHWEIEIGLHWSLDVAFREDKCQVEVNAAENFALMRRIALNLLKKATRIKRGIKSRRKVAGWDHSYLLEVLTADK